MELMEIIKSSLSIFSVISFVFILTSYTIFKIKDRSRIKPYLRVNVQSMYNDYILEESVIEVKKPIPETAVVKENILPKEIIDPKIIQVHERFKIVNTNPVEQKYVPDPEREIEKPIRKIKLNSNKLNIYELYSDSNEKMHKLKLAVM